jgi:hypothetical protein
MRLTHKAAAVAASLAVLAGGTGVAYAASCPGMGNTGTTTSTTGTTTTGTATSTTSSTTNAPRLARHHNFRHAGRL